MDWDELYSDPQIKTFLQDFPRQDWKITLKKIIVFGISSYKSLVNAGLILKKPVPGLKIKIDEIKDSQSKPKDSGRMNTPNRATSHTNFQRKCSGSHSCRHSSQNKSAGKAFKFDKQPPAKKLVGKEIGGKGKSGGLGFQSHVFMVDEGDKGNFVIHPHGKEVKKVKSEAIRSCEKVVPKLLKPVEIKQGKHHNVSSISAQVFCSSSEISD